MNREQIRSLKEYVISNRKDDEMNIVEVCCLIDAWFDSNKVAPDYSIDWSTAPKEANAYQVTGNFYKDRYSEKVLVVELHSEFRKCDRSSSGANVGSVWTDGISSVYILGEGFEVDTPTVCYQYLSDSYIKVESRDAFLAKFRLLQP